MSSEAEFGIAIAGEQVRRFGAGEPVWIEATALFPLLDAEGSHADHAARYWYHSLYLSCITEGDQVPLCANLWKDRMIFGNELERVAAGGSQALRIPLHFELASELGVPLEVGSYHLHLSARQYQSRVLVIEVE